MAKQKASALNAAEIIERIRVAAGSKNLTQLSDFLELSAQALFQTRSRQGISLALLLLAQEKLSEIGVKVSVDYLLHGTCDQRVAGSEDEGREYISVESLDSEHERPVKILSELLRGVDVESARACVQKASLHIIDTSDKRVTSGLYALGDTSRPAILTCKMALTGQLWVQGEEVAQDVADIEKKVIGRVVWSGSVQI